MAKFNVLIGDDEEFIPEVIMGNLQNRLIDLDIEYIIVRNGPDLEAKTNDKPNFIVSDNNIPYDNEGLNVAYKLEGSIPLVMVCSPKTSEQVKLINDAVNKGIITKHFGKPVDKEDYDEIADLIKKSYLEIQNE